MWLPRILYDLDSQGGEGASTEYLCLLAGWQRRPEQHMLQTIPRKNAQRRYETYLSISSVSHALISEYTCEGSCPVLLATEKRLAFSNATRKRTRISWSAPNMGRMAAGKASGFTFPPSSSGNTVDQISCSGSSARYLLIKRATQSRVRHERIWFLRRASDNHWHKSRIRSPTSLLD